MSKIELIKNGGFFPMDQNGFVLNPTGKDKIKSYWAFFISHIIEEYKKQYPHKVHSIYLRGSVAQGLDIERISDLDMFALIHDEQDHYTSWKPVNWLEQYQKTLLQKYEFNNQIDLYRTTYTPNLEEMNVKIQMLLKTQSLCVWGEDVISEIRKFRPGKEMALNIFWIESDLNQTLEKLQSTEDDEKIKELCKSIMKIIVRSGFELIMEEEGKFTNHLYQCFETFSEYYPEKKQLMHTALDLFLNPSKKKIDTIFIIEQLGFWIVKEATKNKNYKF